MRRNQAKCNGNSRITVVKLSTSLACLVVKRKECSTVMRFIFICSFYRVLLTLLKISNIDFFLPTFSVSYIFIRRHAFDFVFM